MRNAQAQGAMREVAQAATARGAGRLTFVKVCIAQPRWGQDCQPSWAKPGGGIAVVAPRAQPKEPEPQSPGSSLFPRPVLGILIFGYHVLPLFDCDDGLRASRFIMYGLGFSPTPEAKPEMAQRLQEHLACVAEEMRPHETGATFVNIRVLGAWNPERTRATYTEI